MTSACHLVDAYHKYFHSRKSFEPLKYFMNHAQSQETQDLSLSKEKKALVVWAVTLGGMMQGDCSQR